MGMGVCFAPLDWMEYPTDRPEVSRAKMPGKKTRNPFHPVPSFSHLVEHS
jgi:hypothetical protein